MDAKQIQSKEGGHRSSDHELATAELMRSRVDSAPASPTPGDSSGVLYSSTISNRLVTWASVGLASIAILGGAFFTRGHIERGTADGTSSPEGTGDVYPASALPPGSAPDQKPLEPARYPLPAPGWHWLVAPTSIVELQRVEPVTFARLTFDEETTTPQVQRDGEEIRIVVPKRPDYSYQLVGFLPSGERIELNPRTRDSFSFGFTFGKYPDLERIGIQSADLAALAESSRKAILEAGSLGIPVLGPVRSGEPYEFSLPTVDGGRISHETFKGKVVVIFEWATWCGACHRMMKDLFQFRDAGPDSIQFVAISHDAPATAAKAVEEMRSFPSNTTNIGLFTFTTQDSESRKIQELWALARKGVNGYGIPTVIVLGPDGKVLLDASSPNPEILRETVVRAVETSRTLAR